MMGRRQQLESDLQRRRALRDRERQFELLIRAVTDYAIYMLDVDGYIQTWNPGGERIKGYTADEVIGTHFSRFYTPEDVAQNLPNEALRIAREHHRFTADGWRVRKDGTRFHASVVIDPIWDEGELIGYAKITRDITQRHEAQQEMAAAQTALLHAQKMEAVGKISLGLAHDFNNLLMVVINSLDLMATRAAGDSQMTSWIESALRASERGSLLTRQLLTFGRGQPMTPELVDINALVRDGLDLYRRAVGSRVEIKLELDTSEPVVMVDRSQLDAAVMNLVCNSRDAIPLRGIVTISTRSSREPNPSSASDPDKDYAVIEVADTGEGMPADVQARVFEPFFTTKEIGKGSGLGLSQVFGLASQSGGFVSLQSEEGKGTTISIFLPR